MIIDPAQILDVLPTVLSSAFLGETFDLSKSQPADGAFRYDVVNDRIDLSVVLYQVNGVWLPATTLSFKKIGPELALYALALKRIADTISIATTKLNNQ